MIGCEDPGRTKRENRGRFLGAPRRFDGRPEVWGGFRDALRRAYDTGVLVACDIVWSEFRAHFPENASFLSTFATLVVTYESLRQEAAELAGEL